MSQIDLNTQGAGTFPLNYLPIRSVVSTYFPVLKDNNESIPPVTPPVVVVGGGKGSHVLNKLKILTSRLKL